MYYFLFSLLPACLVRILTVLKFGKWFPFLSSYEIPIFFFLYWRFSHVIIQIPKRMLATFLIWINEQKETVILDVGRSYRDQIIFTLPTPDLSDSDSLRWMTAWAILLLSIMKPGAQDHTDKPVLLHVCISSIVSKR